MADLEGIRLQANEITCNTVANSVYSNGLIKITNIDTAAHLITLSFANGTVYATTTIAANVDLYIQKGYTDLISSNATTAVVLATPVRRETI